MKFVVFLIFFSAVCLTAQPKLFINELLAANVGGIVDEAGEREDWIELYNAGALSVNLSGYFLSDNPSNLRKWQFPTYGAVLPAQGYLIIWADEQPLQGPMHASFKLSRAGEWLALVNPQGAVVDSLTFGEQTPDVSYGRSPDGGERFIHLTTPTPGAANPFSPFGAASEPRASLESGVYLSRQQVNLSAAEANASIYYTLDGSTPTPEQTATRRYDAPFWIDTTTVVRIRTYAPDYLPSPVRTLNLLISPPHTLPIISVVTDPANLFDEEIGIYANDDSSGRSWERECRIYYFQDERLKFEIPAGIRIQGNSGRVMPKKSFRLHFRNGYGADRLDYPLFDLTDARSFATLVLRAGYDDDLQKETGTLVRDPLVNELYRRLGFPTTHSRFAALYLNERYWGIYDLREDVNSGFIEHYYGIDDADVIRLRFGNNNWEVDYGDGDQWRTFLDFVRSNSFESDDLFAQLERRIDVENFTTLLAVAHATQYRSWTYGAFFIRERTADARWHVTIWDMDRSLTNLGWNGFYYYTHLTGEYWINFIAQKMLKNAAYKNYFINRLADLQNTTFNPETAVPVLDSLALHLSSEIPRELARWSPKNDRWSDNIDFLRRFLTVRPDTVYQQTESFFDLQPALPIQFDAYTERGTMQINSLFVQKLPFTGRYYHEAPIVLTALPKGGYQFAGWQPAQLPQTPSITLAPSPGLSVKALFAPLGQAVDSNQVTVESFELLQNYPNPFNGQTRIAFSLSQKSFVMLSVYDLNGRKIAVLRSQQLDAGVHEATWSTEAVSGIYFLQLQCGSQSAVRKLVLQK